jgi:hypothetical protein
MWQKYLYIFINFVRYNFLIIANIFCKIIIVSSFLKCIMNFSIFLFFFQKLFKQFKRENHEDILDGHLIVGQKGATALNLFLNVNCKF